MTIAPPPLRLAAHRQQFPALANKAYFNYGGQGPLSQSAIAAIQQAHEYAQQQGPFSGTVNAWMMAEADRARAAIASELHVGADTITLTEDVSVGCNIALWGIDWQAGDHLLMSDCEHPGIIAAVHEIQRRFAIEVSVCPLMQTLNEGDPVAIVAQHLRPTTRMVVVSHILWNTGQVMPLGEIVRACRDFSSHNPIHLMVDAAQSIGVLPLHLDELGVDFYAFTGHKWWCGAAGVGGLYVRPDARELLRPTFIGWRSIVYDQQGNPADWRPDGRRYEIATSDFTLYGALCTAIALQNEWGTQRDRYDRICQLSQQLWQQLRGLPQIHCLRTAPPEAGLVSFQVTTGQAHSAIVQTLEQQGIFVRTILNPDCIRACVHYLTLESEIDRLVSAIAAQVQSA